MNGIASTAVIGAGLMGHSIALCFARAGVAVALYDPDAGSRASALTRIASSLANLGDGDEAVSQAVARVRVVDDLAEAVAGAGYITEAAPEKLELKQAIFADLERLAEPEAVLASNTSVMPITAIAGELATRDRIVGTHWWNPGHLIPLVEVVRTAATSDATVERTVAVLSGIGKDPVRVQRDIPGFIGNRLQHALWREAISLVEHGVCTAEEVDLVVTSGFGRRLAVLGPLANADLIGTDLTLDIHSQVLYDLESSPGPSPYLRGLVESGLLGMKSGLGFRSWTEESMAAIRAAVVDQLTRLASQKG